MIIYDELPLHLKVTVEASGCLLESEEKILLLKRAPEKKGGEKWGLPAGKIEAGETPTDAASRELLEETGIQAHPSQFQFVKNIYIQEDNILHAFHIFHLKLGTMPQVQLNAEHTEYQWVFPTQALNLPLLAAEGALIEFILKKKFDNLTIR